MLCFLYFLVVIFSLVLVFGFLSYFKIFNAFGEKKLLLILVFSLGLIFILTIYCLFKGAIGDLFDIYAEEDPRGALGTLGDYFGGILNPIFGFLSFMALIVTILYQSKQLKQNELALEKTREAIEQNKIALAQNASALKINNYELANSTEQLKLATQAHQEMEKTQKTQQFENNFYELFAQLNKLHDFLLENHIENMKNILNKNESLKVTRDMILKDRLLSRYFILLYQVLKMINRKVEDFPSKYVVLSDEWKEEKYKNKKFYTSLIRSQQDILILKLLFINTYTGFDDYKSFLKNSNFFEHINFHLKEKLMSYPLLVAIPYYFDNDKKDLGSESYLLNFFREKNISNIFLNGFVTDTDHINIMIRRYLEEFFSKKNNMLTDGMGNTLSFTPLKKKHSRVKLKIVETAPDKSGNIVDNEKYYFFERVFLKKDFIDITFSLGYFFRKREDNKIVLDKPEEKFKLIINLKNESVTWLEKLEESNKHEYRHIRNYS